MANTKESEKTKQVKPEKAEKAEKPVCLVIMPFSDPKAYEPGHFRKVYDHILAPAIEMAGYTPHRIDENAESTMIHAKLLDQLINAPMVLCDLSSKNPNVLYELGIRHAFDKPVVLVQEKGQDRIFDISGLTTVEYRRERLYDEVIADQNVIAEAIKQNTGNQKYSIMSLVHLDAAEMRSGDHITREDRMEFALAELTRQMNRIEEQILTKEYVSLISSESSDKKNERIEVKKSLVRAINDAERVAEIAGRGIQSCSDFELTRAIYQLRDTLVDYQRLGAVNSHLVEDAVEMLIKLQTIANDRKETVGV